MRTRNGLGICITALLALVMVFVPETARANTAIGGYYLDETNAAIAACGYDYYSLPVEVQGWVFSSTADGGSGTATNPNLAAFAAFRDTVRQTVFGGTFNPITGNVGNTYYSTADGRYYSVMVESAATDISNALVIYDELSSAPSGGGGVVDGDNTVYTLRKGVNYIAGGQTYTYGGVTYQPNIKDFPTIGTNVNAPETITLTVPTALVQRLPEGYEVYAKVEFGGGTRVFAFLYAFDPQGDAHVSYQTYTDTYGGVTYENECPYVTGNGQITYILVTSAIIDSYDAFRVTTTNASVLTTNNNNGVALVPYLSYGESLPPAPEPEPSGPQIDVPTVPTQPSGPNTSGQATPTSDTKPITDRLDTIIAQIAEFEGLFWQFYSDVVDMYTGIWQMLNHWLSLIELNTRNTYVWLQNIFYALDNMGNEISDTNDIFVPVVGNGNTVQTQLAEDAEQLKTKFPFSVPWDLYAMLLVLQAPPHSMIFDVPVAYFDQVETIHIDLSNFQEFYAACRAISLWSFAWWLLQRTRDLLVNWE